MVIEPLLCGRHFHAIITTTAGNAIIVPILEMLSTVLCPMMPGWLCGVRPAFDPRSAGLPNPSEQGEDSPQCPSASCLSGHLPEDKRHRCKNQGPASLHLRVSAPW